MGFADLPLGRLVFGVCGFAPFGVLCGVAWICAVWCFACFSGILRCFGVVCFVWIALALFDAIVLFGCYICFCFTIDVCDWLCGFRFLCVSVMLQNDFGFGFEFACLWFDVADLCICGILVFGFCIWWYLLTWVLLFCVADILLLSVLFCLFWMCVLVGLPGGVDFDVNL